MVRQRRRPVGASRLGCLIQLVVIGALVYFAFLAGEEALNYYRFRDAMKQEARFATLPRDAQDVNIVREGNVIRIWSEYDQTFHLPFNKERTVHLRPSVEKQL